MRHDWVEKKDRQTKRGWYRCKRCGLIKLRGDQGPCIKLSKIPYTPTNTGYTLAKEQHHVRRDPSSSPAHAFFT